MNRRKKHLYCGKTFDVNNFKSFVRYYRCPHCEPTANIKPVQLRKEKFITSLSNKYGDEYTLVGQYSNSTTPTLFMHNPPMGCGSVFEIQPRRIRDVKHLCPYCRSKTLLNNKLSDEYINKILRVLSSGKYSMIRRGKNKQIWILNNESGKAKRMGYKKAIRYLKTHNYSELP